MVQTLKAVNQMSIAEAQFKHLLFHGILLQKSVKLQTVKFESKVSIGLLMDNIYSPWDTILGTYMLSKIWQCALCARWNILHFEINAIVYPALVNLNPLGTIFILRKGVLAFFLNHSRHLVRTFSVHTGPPRLARPPRPRHCLNFAE